MFLNIQNPWLVSLVTATTLARNNRRRLSRAFSMHDRGHCPHLILLTNFCVFLCTYVFVKTGCVIIISSCSIHSIRWNRIWYDLYFVLTMYPGITATKSKDTISRAVSGRGRQSGGFQGSAVDPVDISNFAKVLQQTLGRSLWRPWIVRATSQSQQKSFLEKRRS